MTANICWSPVSPEEEARKNGLYEDNSAELKLYKSDPGDVRMPINYVNRGFKRLKEFQLRPDDLFICSYVKTGTTMTMEIVWQILNGGVDPSAMKDMDTRVPHLEFCDLFSPTNLAGLSPVDRDGYSFAEDLESPRFMKTHMPFDLLPERILDTAKVVYVCRHPIDVGVSYYHHQKLVSMYRLKEDCSMEQFLELFMKGEVQYGDFWHHLKTAWAKRKHPNMKFLWYEEICADFPKAVRELADFVGRSMSEGQIARLAGLMQIDNYRSKIVSSVGNEKDKKFWGQFVRSGTVGNWKRNDGNPIWEKMIEWTKKNLIGTDIPIKCKTEE